MSDDRARHAFFRAPTELGAHSGVSNQPVASLANEGACESGAITERIFVAGGIAEVTPERCTVLADEAIAPDALDRAALDLDLTNVEGNLPSLREQVARAQGTERERLLTELRRLERQQTVARAKLQALAEISR